MIRSFVRSFVRSSLTVSFMLPSVSIGVVQSFCAAATHTHTLTAIRSVTNINVYCHCLISLVLFHSCHISTLILVALRFSPFFYLFLSSSTFFGQ